MTPTDSKDNNEKTDEKNNPVIRTIKAIGPILSIYAPFIITVDGRHIFKLSHLEAILLLAAILLSYASYFILIKRYKSIKSMILSLIVFVFILYFLHYIPGMKVMPNAWDVLTQPPLDPTTSSSPPAPQTGEFESPLSSESSLPETPPPPPPTPTPQPRGMISPMPEDPQSLTITGQTPAKLYLAPSERGRIASGETGSSEYVLAEGDTVSAFWRENGFVYCQHEYNTVPRRGYVIEAAFLPSDISLIPTFSPSNEPAFALYETTLRHTPNHNGLAITKLDKLKLITVLSSASEGWIFVETDINGALVRGYVPEIDIQYSRPSKED